MTINRYLALLGLFLSLVAARSAGAADDTRDQSQTSTHPDWFFYVGADMFGELHEVGQIFLVGMEGYLDRVRVYLENDPSSPATGPITVSIQEVTNDWLPSDREIANATIPLDRIPSAGSPDWVDVSIEPVLVKKGTYLALVLSLSGGTGHIRWHDYIGPSAYPSGFTVGNDGYGWRAGTYDDMTFETYVITPVLDQSQEATNHYSIVEKDVSSGGRLYTQLIAQTFTAGVSGNLHQVRVLLENGTAGAPIAVSIQTVETLLGRRFPTGLQIGSGTIPVEMIPQAGYSDWVDVSINDPPITAGTQYAIILSLTGSGWVKWYEYYGDVYERGTLDVWSQNYWFDSDYDYTIRSRDATFQTYVLPPIITSPAPPPPQTTTPCVNGVCPAAKGGFTLADFTDGIMGHFQFRERPNGTIQGILNFTDSWPDGISLQGCTTESAACRLTVATFACTDQHTITVAGSYTQRGKPLADSYLLTLSGAAHGPGRFTLKAGGKSYTLTRDGITDVTCPAVATLGVEAGRR